MRAIVFIDGQNLFHSAKAAWAEGDSSIYSWPSYDVEKLAQALVSRGSNRILEEICFYTGVPHPDSGPRGQHWHNFWNNKLRHLKSRGVQVYRGKINAGQQEKGVDVSLALDLIKATYEQIYEAAIIVSKDADFGPVVRLAKQFSKSQGRNLVFESAFPIPVGTDRARGVPGTVWIHIDKAMYDQCLDPTDYRAR